MGYDNTEDIENNESSDSEEDVDDVYTEADDSDDFYESDDINDDSEESDDDEIEREISESEDENLAHSADDGGSDKKEGENKGEDGGHADDNKENGNESKSDKDGDDSDSDDDITNAPTISPTFEIVECNVDADCDGYRMECNEYAECAQMTSGSRDGLKRMGDGYLRIGRAAQAGDGRNEQMNVFRSRVIYVDDIKAMLTNPMWLSGVVLLLLMLAARPMYSSWARREYKRLAPQMDVETGYQSCV